MDKPHSAICNLRSAIEASTLPSAMTVWQLVDSAFPSGSFAHSLGLEAAYQAGEVCTDEALRQFVTDSLWQTGHAALPLVTAAHRDPRRLEELDAVCDAFLTNAIANRASRVQGRAMSAACVRIWPSDGLAAFDARARRSFAHQGPVTGAALRLLDVPLGTAQQMTLFVAARSVLAAAVRLGLVGPYRAQQLQHGCAADIGAVLRRCASLDESQLAQSAPLIDVLQSSHDRLYSRLFQS
jgi:urease accessory protein